MPKKSALLFILFVVAIVGLAIIILDQTTLTLVNPRPACVAVPSFACLPNATMNTKGQVSFTFIQSTGETLYNVSFACLVETNNHLILGNSDFNTTALIGNNSIESGATSRVVVNLPCHTADGSVLTSQKIGTQFDNVSVWIRYFKMNKTVTVTSMLSLEVKVKDISSSVG